MEIRIKPLQVAQCNLIAQAIEICYNLIYFLHASIAQIVQSLIIERSKSDYKAFLLIWLKKCVNPHKNSRSKVISILLTGNIFSWVLFCSTTTQIGTISMVSFVLTPRCFTNRLAATTFYRLQRGSGDMRQCPHKGNIVITVPLPTIIVRHWFFRINVRCGFSSDALILRTFDTYEKYSSWWWWFLQFIFFLLQNIHYLNLVSRTISMSDWYNLQTYSSSASVTLLSKGT